MDAHELVLTLSRKLKNHATEENVIPMQAYMRDQFPFHGIKSEARKAVTKNFYNEHKQVLVPQVREFAMACFEQPYRELHYSAQELLQRVQKDKWLQSDFDYLCYLALKHPWWDTIDFIAKHLLGNYFTLHTRDKKRQIAWLNAHGSLWLNRSAILHQLSYKQDTDEELLYECCRYHMKDPEFFIQKAIGWSLREYAKVNPESVVQFVTRHETEMSKLAYREATKHL